MPDRALGQHQQVLPGRVGGARRGRAGPGARCAGAGELEGQLGAEHRREADGPGRHGEADDAVEAVVVGDGQGREAEPGRLVDQLLGVARTVEEGEVRVAVQLGVHRDRDRIEQVFDRQPDPLLRVASELVPASPTGAVITVAGLHKSYGRHEAVKGIDFEVASGEIFGLLGTNGAGKTTTIEILEGYRTRTSGDVRVLGVDPGRPTRAWRERIGLVLQESEVDPVYTVREIVGMFSRYYSEPRDVDDTITLVGLHAQRDTRVGQLSGGQKRRVDVALGIVGDPDLLFLDEPTTGFDPQARRDAWNMIEGLRDLGKTILLTTHYMDEAQHLADRLTILRDGLVVAKRNVRGADPAVRWRHRHPVRASGRRRRRPGPPGHGHRARGVGQPRHPAHREPPARAVPAHELGRGRARRARGPRGHPPEPRRRLPRAHGRRRHRDARADSP